MTGRPLFVVLALALAACVTPDEPVAAACPAGTEPRAGICFAVPETCDATSVPVPTGGCLAVGMTTCAEGFVADGEAGCSPVLPKESCAPGKMALPGDATCHEIAPCGEGPYGDAPATAVHVDGSYTGPDSDGSLARPYARIGDAISAAATDATIAIAAGTYVENLFIRRRTTLWGRCPSMVEVRGDPSRPTTYTVDVITSSTVRGLALTGPFQAISVRAGTVTLERLWVHDAGEHGVDLQQPSSSTTPTVVTLKDSLVEKNHWSGVLVLGAKATLDSVVVRDNVPDAEGTGGMGINLGTWRKAPAQPVILHRVLAERNALAAIAVTGVTASIDGSVLRDSVPEPSGAEARGLGVWNDPGNVNVGDVSLADSYVAGNRGLGIQIVGGKATVERVVVRDQGTRAKDDAGGDGIVVSKGGTLTLRDSLVRGNRHAGVLVAGSLATIERCLVRDTAAATDGRHGVGIAFTSEGVRTSEGAVFDAIVRGSRYVGVAAIGSRLELARVVVDATASQLLDGKYGDGVVVSSENLAGSVVAASLVTTDVHVTSSARAAMSVFGGDLVVSRTVLSCAGFDLEVSNDFTGRSETPGRPFALTNGGETVCGCKPVWKDCKAQSSGLEPIPTP